MRQDTCGRLSTEARTLFTGVAGVSARVAAAVAALGLKTEGRLWRDTYGRLVYVKVQGRSHERPGDSTRGLGTPMLIGQGTLADGSWWEVITATGGEEVTDATAAQATTLGSTLSRWHRHEPLEGLRLDDPTGLETWLGTAIRFQPVVFPVLAAASARVFAGLPMVSVHGDVAVTHNCLWDGDVLAGLVDPGAVAVAPAVLDLGFAAARDKAASGRDSRDALLAGYGSTPPGWAEVLPVVAARTWVDCLVGGDRRGQERIAPWMGEMLTRGLRARIRR